MVAFFSNFWARIKFFSSKWPWEKSSFDSAIIWDTLETKKWKFNKKGCWWRPPSKMANFWARIKFYSSKWLWEKSSLVSAIILDALVIKKTKVWQERPQWRPPSKIVNFWARIKFYSSKWSGEKSWLVSAIILDTLVIKKRKFDKKMKRQIQGNKSTFLLITLDHFWLENQIQWEKLSRKNTHIYFFYFWFKSKRVWTSLDEFGRKKSKAQKLQKINLTTIS